MKDLARFKFNYSECEPLLRERWQRVEAFIRNICADKDPGIFARDYIYNWFLWKDNRQKRCLADSDSEVGNEEKDGN